ncbi:phage T7 F exclusion suppressor FxsA [Stieleria bergensis]|uniref:Phage T7 F exclusion suppressor FxsA n=1 Tax=Stieleria bergensis TaxID=2528025 RepID=A0A517SPI3_9BACT|nr:phage T7 F exclusion suppressor FxsA [Planctomycetes bacterium SV_7m_r]
MLFRLLILFVTVPLVELVLLLQIAEVTGVGATLLLVLLTGIAGWWLAKREGLIAWQKFQQALQQGRVPGKEIQDGLMIVFAAALLLTPGLLTDVVGFTLLLPMGRDLLRKLIFERFLRSNVTTQFRSRTFYSSTSFGSSRGAYQPTSLDDSDVIDGKVAQRSE